MMRPEREQSIIQHSSHPHPLQLISTQANGSTYACKPCNFNLVLSGPAAHPPTLQRPPCPSEGAQVQTQYPVPYYDSFSGAGHQIQSGTSRPQGVNYVPPGQSVGVNPNSQVGRPGVSWVHSMTTTMAHGFAAGAAPAVGRYLTQDLMHHGSGGGGGGHGGGRGRYGGGDAGGYDGGGFFDAGGYDGGYDGGGFFDAGGYDGGYDGGGFFDAGGYDGGYDGGDAGGYDGGDDGGDCGGFFDDYN